MKCDTQNNSPLKVSTFSFPEPVNMLGCMVIGNKATDRIKIEARGEKSPGKALSLSSNPFSFQYVTLGYGGFLGHPHLCPGSLLLLSHYWLRLVVLLTFRVFSILINEVI